MEAHGEKAAHKDPIPYGKYVMVWFGLIGLTGFTITAAGLHFGRWSVLAAIAVAAVKGTLVVAHFMRLRQEERLFRIMLYLALGTLAVIMLMTFADTAFR